VSESDGKTWAMIDDVVRRAPCPRCAEQRAMAEELNDTLNAVLDERDALQARLDAIRAAYQAHREASVAYLEGWGTASATVTEEERAYRATNKALAQAIKGEAR